MNHVENSVNVVKEPREGTSCRNSLYLNSARLLQTMRVETPMARTSKAGRNDDCPCGSGKKNKRCCQIKQESKRGSRVMTFVVLAILAGAIVAAVTSLGEDSTTVATPGRVWSPEHGHYH